MNDEYDTGKETEVDKPGHSWSPYSITENQNKNSANKTQNEVSKGSDIASGIVNDGYHIT